MRRLLWRRKADSLGFVNWSEVSPHQIAAHYGFDGRNEWPAPWTGDPASTLGGGGGLVEFEAQISADPVGFGGAWAPIEAQLTSEFATLPDIQGAKTAFADAYTQMSDQLSVSAQDALRAAQQYILIGKTIAGAVSTVSDLVASAGAATSPLAAAQFVGTMIGGLGTLAVGLGATGVGAAICGVAAGLLAIMESAGLFGHAPAGNLPGCTYVSCTGEWVVGCICCTSGERSAPKSANWRSFPADDGNPDDAPWFAKNCYWNCKDFQWKGLTYRNDFTSDPESRTDMRPIDYAFGLSTLMPSGGPGYTIEYRAIEVYARGLAPAPTGGWWGAHLDTTRQPLPLSAAYNADFLRAFATAWKANAEYALNGMKPQDDSLVLTHTLKLWNRAHEGPQVPWTWTNVDEGLMTLVGLAFNTVQTSDADVAYQGTKQFYMNTGPLKQAAVAPQAVAASQAADAAALAAQQAADIAWAASSGASATAPAVTTSTSGAAPAIAGAVAIATLGGLWFLLGQPMTIAALKGAARQSAEFVIGAVTRA